MLFRSRPFASLLLLSNNFFFKFCSESVSKSKPIISQLSASSFNSLSPLDGRYAKSTEKLRKYFSQSALMKYRVKVEAEWMLHLMKNGIISVDKQCSLQEIEGQLKKLHENFNQKSASRIKEIEKTTNHDLKSVQYFMKENISWYKQNVHLCCTSQDINNLSYSLMLAEALNQVIIPALHQVERDLVTKSVEWSSDAMLARTHGQPATPTTLGKQFANFAYRLKKQIKYIKQVKLTGKINGAVGNYNAHYFSYPQTDWITLNRNFVENCLGLEFNPYTTQIQSHDSLARVFGELALSNTILIGLCRDVWEYTSKGYLRQKVKAGEVGSSTMPHKVNPIDFQNCEGNLGIANSILQHLREKLPISRLQRDLSDSTVLRNQGSALGYTLIGYGSLLKGLSKISSNKQYMQNDLSSHHEVITEAIQTQLRKIGFLEPYELLKQLSRGQSFNDQTKKRLVEQLKGKVNADSLQKISKLRPQTYLGKAEELAKKVKQY